MLQRGDYARELCYFVVVHASPFPLQPVCLMFGVLGPRCWTRSSMLDCHLVEGVWYMIGILGSLY